MARVFTSGFELNSTTAGIEWTGKQGSPTIATNPVRTGGYSCRTNSAAVTSFEQRLLTADGNGPFYVRTYIYVATMPNVRRAFLYLGTSGGVQRGAVALDTDGTLKLFTFTNMIGSASPVLNTNQWYMVELYLFNNTVSGKMEAEARLDGVVFATTTTDTQTSTFGFVRVGWQGAGGDTVDMYFDDVAVNDNSGANQTSYPGQGKVVMLRPSADGDAHQWLDTAASAGTANNYQLVDELPPNDATDFVQSGILVTDTASAVDMYNVTDAGLRSVDSITMVDVGGRFRDGTVDATTAFKFQIEKAGSGTKTQSAAIVPNSTTWQTNSAATTHLPSIVTYTDPDGAAWTNTTVDSMQIGQTITTQSVNRIQVSAIWANVEYVLGASPSPSANLMGVGS